MKPDMQDIMKLMQANQNDNALALLNERIKTPGYDEHSDLAPLHHRAWLLMCSCNYEAAAEDYRRILNVTPDDITCRSYLADCLARNGNIEEAKREALETLGRDIGNMTALRVMARCYHAVSGETGSAGRERPEFKDISGCRIFDNEVIRFIEQHQQNVSIHASIGHLIYWLVRYLKPLTAVETGSFIGYSSLCIAQALKDNNQGHLHSFDLFEHVVELNSPFVEGPHNILETTRIHARHAGLDEWVTFHAGDSSSSIIRHFDQYPDLKIDFAFIDGDHTVRGCLKDWVEVEKRLSDNGVVLLHDINPLTCNWYGPRYLMEHLQVKDPEGFDIMKFPTPDNTGLGIIRRNSSRLTEWKPGMFDLIRDFLLVHAKWPRK